MIILEAVLGRIQKPPHHELRRVRILFGSDFTRVDVECAGREVETVGIVVVLMEERVKVEILEHIVRSEGISGEAKVETTLRTG